MDEIINKIKNELTIEELSDIVKESLAMIYRKLREDEGFGWDMSLSGTIGSEEYDVEILIINNESHNQGTYYLNTYKL